MSCSIYFELVTSQPRDDIILSLMAEWKWVDEEGKARIVLKNIIKKSVKEKAVIIVLR